MKEIAIAATPISGDFAAAALKPKFIEITSVAPPTVNKPDKTPANAPIFVILLETELYVPDTSYAL